MVAGAKLVAWDFRAHRQFELSAEYAKRLVNLVYGKASVDVDSAIDKDLIRSGIVSRPYDCDVVWGWDVLSKIFHFGTKNIPVSNLPDTKEEWAKQYIAHCEEAWEKTLPIENTTLYEEVGFQLPVGGRNDNFHQLLKRRSTCRAFMNQPIHLQEVSQVLSDALRFVPERELSIDCGLPDTLRKRRSSPSGGGMNATEGYLYARSVVGLASGLYYYDPNRHQLHLISSELPELGSLLAGQHFANDLPVGVFLTSRLDKLWWKYEHSRTYRMALVEVGHVAQTLQLSATALGLSTWLTGALTEKNLDPYLRLQIPGEEALFFVGWGHSDGLPIPKVLR